MGGGGRLPIAEGENRSDLLLTKVALNSLGETRGGIAGLLKMKRDCSVGPGVFELVTAIAADDDGDAQSARRFGEATCLIAQLAGEQKQRWRLYRNY